MRIKKEVGHVLKLCLQTLTSPSITDDSKRMVLSHCLLLIILSIITYLKKNVLNLCKNESPEKMGVDFLYSSKTSFQELIRAILKPPNKQYRGYGLYKDLAETKFVSFLDFWAKK